MFWYEVITMMMGIVAGHVCSKSNWLAGRLAKARSFGNRRKKSNSSVSWRKEIKLTNTISDVKKKKPKSRRVAFLWEGGWCRSKRTLKGIKPWPSNDGKKRTRSRTRFFTISWPQNFFAWWICRSSETLIHVLVAFDMVKWSVGRS